MFEEAVAVDPLAGLLRVGDGGAVFTNDSDLADRIVSLRAAREILKVVGSREKRFEEAPGGHAGVFAGSKAPGQCWRVIADWLEARAD